jgi:undecaprenyl-diphosphatase
MTTNPERSGQKPAKPRAWAGWIEIDILLAGLAIAGALWAFMELAEVARDSAPHAFDTAILLAFRQPGHPDLPIGPAWLEGAVRDITALGSTSVLVLIVAAAVVYFFLIRRPRTALFMLCAVVSGQVLSSLLKLEVDRPRPELVSHLVTETSLSFPSGHAMLSAITYLTLGALAARFLPGRVTRIYVLSLAVLVTLMVGASRVYLGVHWPSDVLAGWCAGFAWAMLWWLAARLLQRRGSVGDDA